MDDQAPSWAQTSSPDTPSWAGSSAAPSGPSAVPNWAHQESWGNTARGLHGAYMDSVTNGLMMQPVRWAMQYTPLGEMVSGVGINQIKQRFPGQTDQWYQTKLNDLYNQAVTSARQTAHQEVVDNPYPGHQVGNFVANVLGSADPTWAVAPGGGVTKDMFAQGVTKAIPQVASAVARTAGKQALLASASNDAAQAMDMLSGQKKDFDIQQNLEATAFGGAFGAAHAGVVHPIGEAAQPVVSDFVKGLYKNRGMDTTPGADPRGSTSPMTGSTVTMSPEDQQTFKGLLRTGSVDDIKNFLDTKQGPKPSWVQVNQAVQLRDSMPENFVGSDNFHEAMGAHLDDMHKQVVQDHINTQTADWKNKPDFELINHVDEIQDPQIRQQAINDGAQENGLGFVGQDGKVRVFANRMDSPDTLNAVLYHESLGHYGLQQKFGDRLDSTLQTLMDRNVGKFGQEVDQWQAKNPGAYGGDRVRAAEEVLAEKSQNGQMKTPWSDAVVANLRQFGRKMGLNLSYSDSEIQHILAMAHDAVINGKGRDVRANNFGGTQQTQNPGKWLNMTGVEPEHAQPVGDYSDAAHNNRYMFTGPKGRNFNPDHPLAFDAEDGVRRNEINDSRATVNIPHDRDHFKLDEILDHPRLFEEYPQLHDVNVERQSPWQSSYGTYDDGKITFNPRDPDIRSTILHEVQHAIQDIERYPGYEDTDTMKMSLEDHKNNPFEKEAYETENRKDLNFTDRVENSPNRFLTKQQLAATSADYQIKNMEKAYEATDKDYIPTYRSNEEVTQAALDQGFSPGDVKKLGRLPDLPKRIARMTYAAKVLDQRISDIEDKMLVSSDPDLMDQYRQAIADHHLILTKLRDDRGEIARALQISKLGYTRAQMESFGELLKEQGGSLAGLGDDDTLLKFARQMKAIRQGGANPAGVNNMVSALSKPNWEDYLTTLHQGFMLSGLSTHVKAPTDMIIGIGRDLLNSSAALVHTAAVDALNAIPGVNIKPGVHPAEASMRMWGIFKAALDAGTYINSAKTFVSGVNPTGAVTYGGKPQARVPVVSKVMDLISAQDAFFRAFATNMHLYGLAARDAVATARRTGGSMKFDDLINQASANARQPTPTLLREAREAADKTLLLNKNGFTEPLDRWKQTTSNSPALRRAGAFIANFLTPFVRVESNSLYNRVIRNSPLTLLDPQTYKELASGGETQGIALARVVFALAPTAYYWSAAGQGKVTGDGPDNPAKRAELEATGWRPEAVHENGQYNTGDKLGQSLNPWDLHNETATSIAKIREAWEKGGNAGQVLNAFKLSSLSAIKSLTTSSWINSIAPAVDAFTAPNTTLEQKADRFAANEAATMVPNLIGQAARVEDQNQPDTSEPSAIPGTVKAAIPGLRETLPVRYDPYGNPVQSGASGFGTHTWAPQDNRLTGGNHVDETHDPAEQELARLSSQMKGALVTPVQKTITVNGQKMKLTPAQVGEYQHLVGRNVVEYIRQEMQTPEWHQMSDNDRAYEVKDIEKDMRKAVKEHLYGQ